MKDISTRAILDKREHESANAIINEIKPIKTLSFSKPGVEVSNLRSL